jgi:hypothetical protein
MSSVLFVHCLESNASSDMSTLALCVTAAGILICMVRDVLPKRAAKWVPSPMAMSIPFYIGAASVRAGLHINVHLAYSICMFAFQYLHTDLSCWQ